MKALELKRTDTGDFRATFLTDEDGLRRVDDIVEAKTLEALHSYTAYYHDDTTHVIVGGDWIDPDALTPFEAAAASIEPPSTQISFDLGEEVSGSYRALNRVIQALSADQMSTAYIADQLKGRKV